MTEGGEMALALAFGAGLVGLTFGPIGRAIGRWIESKISGPRAETEARQAELEARMHELEDGARQVGELEERLDFAERLLAAQRDPAALRDKGAMG